MLSNVPMVIPENKNGDCERLECPKCHVHASSASKKCANCGSSLRNAEHLDMTDWHPQHDDDS